MKSLTVTIRMKATEQYFPVVLFIMLYKMVLTFESADEMVQCDNVKAINRCFPALLFIMLYKLVSLWTKPQV